MYFTPHPELPPEEQLKELESFSTPELIANTKQLLGKFPNTYTYTKNLC